jgi:hypothetical protein
LTALRDFGESIKALGQQSSYGKKLQDKVEANVQAKVVAFAKAVKSGMHQTIHATHQNVLTVGKDVEDLGTQVGNVNDTLVAAHQDIRQGMQAYNDMREFLRGLFKDLKVLCK